MGLIYFVIFGIAFANGKPTSDEASFVIASENELQSLLKTLYSQGKFDVALSHHSDGPKVHHDDSAHLIQHDDHHHHHQSSDESHSHGHLDHHGNHKHTNVEEHPNLTNIQTLNIFYKKKPLSDTKFNDGASRDDDEIANLLGLNKKHVSRTANNDVDAILNLMKELEDKADDDRCEGNECKNRSCVGDRCGMNDDDYRSPCVGDRCGTDRDDDDRACVGDRCGSDRNDGDRKCVGDRCGTDRNDDDRACVDDRCGRAIIIEDDSNNNVLRCVGDRCETVDDRDDCRGDICGRPLRERRLPQLDKHVNRQLLEKAFSNKIPINDKLDAIVIDMADLEKVLRRPHHKKNNGNQQPALQLIENVELENLLDDNRVLANSKSPIEAIVVELDKGKNDFSKEINELVKDLEMPVKRHDRNKIRSFKSTPLKAKGNSMILTHNEDNNNVYVPQWLLDEAVLKTVPKPSLRDPYEQAQSKALPLTLKQKDRLLKSISSNNNRAVPKRIFRRSIDDIGVPFHLEIQGLGQVNP